MRRILWVLILLIASQFSYSQTKTIKGIVKDTHSDEAIPFASIQFNKTGFGKLTDSAGKFSITLSKWIGDTLIISYAGFETKKIKLDTSLNALDLIVLMERGKPVGEVVIKSKINRGLLLWKKIVKNKYRHDPSLNRNYRYELYNKLQIDLNKIDKGKLDRSLIPKPFKFIFNNIDTTTEEHAILPLYLTETISDYYYQRDPKKYKEIIKGNKTLGVSNNSFSKFLGGMYQNINVYQNFIPVFDLNFVSPISDNGDNYYNYKVPDTQYIAGKRYFHFLFYPKRKGENTFQGDAWIADTSFAVYKMNLQLSNAANVNFVEKLSLVQEFQLINDTTWFLAKDKFVADFFMLSKNAINFIGRKTTTYKDIFLNDQETEKLLAAENLKESIVLNKEANQKTDSFWVENRHEALNQTEKKIYQTIDTVLNLPVYQKWKDRLYFWGVGYKNIGNWEIGPWFNWLSGNRYEGYRARFDIGTNTKFSKDLYLHGYLAYGFKDRGIKGMLEAKYMFKRDPRSYFHAIYKDDIDYGQTYYDEVSYDNIFTLAIRKNQVPLKLLRIRSHELNYFKEWKNGFSFKTTLNRIEVNPLINLPGKELFPLANGSNPFRSFEATLKLRFAYLEKYVESNFNRITLGSTYPIGELRFTKAIPGVLGSNANYSRISFNVSDWITLPPYGSFYWDVFAGKTIGQAPYMFLNIAPGNEIYYYNKYAFNLMNRYQFISDRYAGFIVEHNVGNGIFRLLSPIRTLKLRQFWNIKFLTGSLSEQNQRLNFVAGHPFTKLDKGPYIEAGTGVDNIFRLFRIDLIWRISPRPLPEENYQRFGVFGSFRVSF